MNKYKFKNAVSTIAAMSLLSVLLISKQYAATSPKWFVFYNPATGQTMEVECDFNVDTYDSDVAAKRAQYEAQGWVDVTDGTYEKNNYINNPQEADKALAEQAAQTAAEMGVDTSKGSSMVYGDGVQGGENSNDAGNESVSQDTANIQESNKTEKTSKEYSHGVYDEINEEAIEAFKHFTADGVADSCYIEVKNTAENKVMPASAIVYTHAGKESGEVRFVNDDGNLVYSVIFEQIETDKDLDLTFEIENKDNMIYLIPKDAENNLTDLGYTLEVKIPTGNASTDYHMYTEVPTSVKYEKYWDLKTDTEGFATLKFTKLQTYVVSQDELTEKNETVVESEEQEVKAEEPEEVVEEDTEDQQQVSEDTSAVKEETEVENTEVEQAPVNDSKNKSIPVIPIILIVMIVCAGSIVFVKRKR